MCTACGQKYKSSKKVVAPVATTNTSKPKQVAAPNYIITKGTQPKSKG